MNDGERRKLLGDFLRKRRAGLTPHEAGIPSYGQRRKPGLRREEVAQLAHVGVSWYTWLEQGRDIKPSAQVLESLSQALKLTPDERRHLFSLSGQSLPPQSAPADRTVRPPYQQVIDELSPTPAYVIGYRWDYLAWNKAAEEVFAISHPNPPHDLNLLWHFFASPIIKERFREWQQMARGVVAEFHTVRARYLNDPSLNQLIEDLKQVSPDFCHWWLEHDARSLLDGYIEIEHPVLGRLEFEHMTLQVPSDPDVKMMIYPPFQDTREKLVHYFASG
ncbi:helix-turn-helix transcriptional regulator [Paenibacillus methanolicus]|uniref:Transcriptional regulator with XRE-family HTH domain n=1 Tax=Paenibacillus methanolicus TaxID=582686 RepID=A0A5S5BMH7_9BACL|nr:helix-turn-helix transcriptional regulator [Paenibacillus methanolicus]TYP67372.1 transcriptional regulator with XRE-family HTH domain [Paenibacillus methanolicus]